MGWFGSVGLEWKYSLILVILLVITIVAGLIKVTYNRRRLKKHVQLKAEGGKVKNEQLALADRPKGEGDLFGLCALEAGYYGGVAQSRPTSRVTSLNTLRNPSINTATNTLVGSIASPTPKLVSPAASVTYLPHARNSSADLLTSSSPPRRNRRPTLKLEPSQAELNGRMNHGAVEIRLEAPTSQAQSRGPMSPTESEGGSEGRRRSPGITLSAESDTDGPISPGPLKPRYYSPQLPQVESVSPISWQHFGADDEAANTKSVVASSDHTPRNSEPPSPAPLSLVYTPRYISRRSRDEPRSNFPVEPTEGRGTGSVKSRWSSHNVSLLTELEDYLLQPKVYVPTHRHNVSMTESEYSTDSRRFSSHRPSVSSITHDTSTGSKLDLSRSASIASRRNSGGSSLAPPSSRASGKEGSFSDFYNAYYRDSSASIAQQAEAIRPKTLIVPRHSTIIEVPTPLASPAPVENQASLRFEEIGMAL